MNSRNAKKSMVATTVSTPSVAVASKPAVVETSAQKNYSFIRNLPVAQFAYKGSHSKPIRRTVLITEISDDLITGLEVQEGRNRHEVGSAQVKSYSREKVRDLTRISMKQFQS